MSMWPGIFATLAVAVGTAALMSGALDERPNGKRLVVVAMAAAVLAAWWLS